MVILQDTAPEVKKKIFRMDNFVREESYNIFLVNNIRSGTWAEHEVNEKEMVDQGALLRIWLSFKDEWYGS